MPLTNYTHDFKGMIDYIFYPKESMRPLGYLGPMDTAWIKENKVIGCPHPHVPSGTLIVFKRQPAWLDASSWGN